jgi:hypothetical protein
MEISRTEEGIALIEKEMINYIIYYNNKVLVALNIQQASLEKCLTGIYQIICKWKREIFKKRS